MNVTPIVSGLCLAALLASACAPSRTSGPGRPLGSYDYVVVSQKDTNEYFDETVAILGQPFVAMQETDPRLAYPNVAEKTCRVAVDWAPGFWSTSGWVELRDHRNGDHVHTSHMRRGMFWVGAHADVMEALRDTASARAAGPPLPPDARDPVDARTSNRVSESVQSKSDRLEALTELRTRGLITDAEYTRQRAKILDD
jgi:hypothetical protein